MPKTVELQSAGNRGVLKVAEGHVELPVDGKNIQVITISREEIIKKCIPKRVSPRQAKRVVKSNRHFYVDQANDTPWGQLEKNQYILAQKRMAGLIAKKLSQAIKKFDK